ncbi:hypothetical protein [Burkholderia dolosa]|uniref:hypothetical protein n=1 Tax=Burkholderia dolosa TaxID=152500 RepID=UPI001C93B7B8|nr:hypothetical protein [Burkholderia dolosa]MBY4828699.1 hypothetical protein [Burkholderia dolosa]
MIDNAKICRAAIERRFPKVLAEELSCALRCVERLIPDPDERLEMLARFRRNRARRIAAWGLEPSSQAIDGCEHIPIEYDGALCDVDRAFAKLVGYRVHPEDYASTEVAVLIGSALQSRRASRPRNRKDGGLHEEIAGYLRRRGIKCAQRGEQKGIVQDAVEYFKEQGLSVSETTIRRVIREHGLGTKHTK